MKFSLNRFISVLIAGLLFWTVQSFVPQAFRPAVVNVGTPNQQRPIICAQHEMPIVLQRRQRKLMASIQTMGLFSLGTPGVIPVILVASSYLLGPLTELGIDAGKISGELKEVIPKDDDDDDYIIHCNKPKPNSPSPNAMNFVQQLEHRNDTTS